MSGVSKYDDLLLNILEEEGQIIPFLDAIFGFLQRRTDFYIVQENPHTNIGFPPGVAEHAVRVVFKKWQKLTSTAACENTKTLVEGDMSGLIVHEEEVVTTEDSPDLAVDELMEQLALKNHIIEDLSSNTYNGANCGNYRWSQTLQELDIEVLVPKTLTKSSDVHVDIQSSELSVSVKDTHEQWSTVMNGQLSHRHFKEESIWTLLPGRHVTIHLQKAKDQWWDSLLLTEPKLDLTKLDVTRHVRDLPDEDHMQVEKVIVQEERKRQGLIYDEHQEKVQMLKNAWDLEGSPFQGTPFNPSVLQLPP